MYQITTKHKNRYKVFQVSPLYNAHPYFSIKNLGKKCALYMAKCGVVSASILVALLEPDIYNTSSFGSNFSSYPTGIFSQQ